MRAPIASAQMSSVHVLLAAFTSLFVFAPLPLDGQLETRGGLLRANSNGAGRSGAGAFLYDVWENASAGQVVANLTRDALLAHDTLSAHRALFESAPEATRLTLQWSEQRPGRWFRVDEAGVVSVVHTPDREDPLVCTNQLVDCVLPLYVFASVDGCQRLGSGSPTAAHLPSICQSESPSYPITVRLSIRDVNDHQPAFATDQNGELPILYISETDSVNTRRALPLASDRDLGNNSLVRYNKTAEQHVFADPNTPPANAPARGEYFTLEASPSSGNSAVQRLELVLRRPIDRELIESVIIDVTASDAGSPPLSTVGRFRVSVNDANDNAPRFRNSTYVVSVPESDGADGLPFLRVEATDADRSSPNNDVRFELVPASQFVRDLVHVEPVDGTLYLKQPLDYEAMQELTFQVVAVDQGVQNRHTATATVVLKACAL